MKRSCREQPLLIDTRWGVLIIAFWCIPLELIWRVWGALTAPVRSAQAIWRYPEMARFIYGGGPRPANRKSKK